MEWNMAKELFTYKMAIFTLVNGKKINLKEKVILNIFIKIKILLYITRLNRF